MKSNLDLIMITTGIIALMVVMLVYGYDLGMSRGRVMGAKIGMALESPDGYRAADVRGSCEDVFQADECAHCHDM